MSRLELFRKLEWAAVDYRCDEPMCPLCQGWKVEGHTPECELAAAIREEELAVAATPPPPAVPT